MANSLSIESILIQVRAKLQEEGIKLWLAPYYVEGLGPVDAELESLAQNMCQILNIPYDYCSAAINELQTNAIDKLTARDDFIKTGTATIKVRVPGQNAGVRLLTIQTKLDVLAEDLYEKIGMQLNMPPSQIKLISSGAVVHRLQLLVDQGIQNNQQMMAIYLHTNTAEANAESAMNDKVQTTKDDAKTLLNKSDSYMDMEDQDGNIIHLPPEEKRALMMALAMHEKGRAALKREEFAEALILLLEADHEYKTCNSKMVESVDNYALLNLDIVWCYLMLKSVSQLPDAENRLKICERHFKKSYGENMDRVMTLKGNAVNEKALIMRLHLLQAVMQFHRNQRQEAFRLLSLAEIELEQLQVNEETAAVLMEMGYTAAEARIGLRACSNNIDQAITYISDRSEKRRNARKLGDAQRKVKQSLVKTKDEKWVNPRNLHILSEMGFDKDVCAISLQKTDNDINQAISMLQENENILQQELTKSIVPNDKLRSEMEAMGFHPAMIDMALKNATNLMDDAVEMLLKMQSQGTYEEKLTALLANMPHDLKVEAIAGPSTSKVLQKEAEEMEAYERFAKDVKNNDDDYLDLPLVQERKLLTEYKKLFNV